MKNEERDSIAVSSDAFFFEKDKSDCTLILGIGNYLMGDEGVGVQLIQEMAKKDLPENIDILDGGTGGFLLLNCFEAYGRIIFVDATMDGKEEGSISLIKPKFAADFPTALSVHDVGLKDMIESVYLMDSKPEMYLFTISIKEMKPMTLELSPRVKKAIPETIEQILELTMKLQTINA
jgi:hydrogenase maturation protease